VDQRRPDVRTAGPLKPERRWSFGYENESWKTVASDPDPGLSPRGRGFL
jgi:hypothetical protein